MDLNRLHSDELNQQMLMRLGYEIHPRTFAQMRKFFSLDYNRNQFHYKDNEVIYSGAEHSGDPKLPNLTILPHLETRDKFIAGSTFGHTHIENDEREFQEIYEFCGYGGMLIYEPLQPDFTLHVLKPGEKVTVSTRENMTLFNLDNKELVTLDYANPLKNRAHKDLENRLGTLLTIEQKASYESVTFYTSESQTTFRINPQYVEERLVTAHSKELSTTFFGASLGDELYQALREHGEERLGKIGLKLSFGGNAMQFPEPLMQYALRQDAKLLNALGIKNFKEYTGSDDHEPI